MSRPGLMRIGLLVAALVACGPAEPEYYGTTYEPARPAEDFTLTDQHGREFRLVDYRDRIVLLFFGYAHCPDVCPVTLSTWARVHQAFGDVQDVEFVFVTVDPERDTAERLREHLAIFSEEFHGLTGTADQLKQVYERYGIHHEKVGIQGSEIGYVVDHSTLMLLLDRQGRIRVSLPFDADPKRIIHDVKRLLES